MPMPVRCPGAAGSSRARLLRWLWPVVALSKLLAWGASPEGWADRRQFEPFDCRANFALSEEAPLLTSLQMLRRDVIELLGVRPSAEPVELYLFTDKPSYQGYLGENYPAAPTRRALFIKGDGPGMVFAFRSRELAVDLRHETTHAVLHASLDRVPLWLDEGLAEYFEVPREERLTGHPHLASVRWALWHGLTPLAELEAKSELNQMARRDYRDAWAWVHFMLHGPQAAHEELLDYVRHLNAAEEPEPLSARLARRILDLNTRFHDHFRQSAEAPAD